MPVQANIGVQTTGTIAWDGAAAASADVRHHIRFGWVFEITATLAVDAVFKVQAAPASAADNCLPGVFTDVEAMGTCQSDVIAGTAAQVIIPAGTVVGTVCSGTIPCRAGAFVRLASVSGPTTDVRAILLRQGPKMTR